MEEGIRLWFEPAVQPIPGMGFPPKDLESARHGRIEQRTITVSSPLKDFLPWPCLEQLFKLERRFTFTKTGKVQERVIYGITSLGQEEITPAQLLEMTRAQWGIANGLHYRRDVTLLEGRRRMTKGKNGTRRGLYQQSDARHPPGQTEISLPSRCQTLFQRHPA